MRGVPSPREASPREVSPREASPSEAAPREASRREASRQRRRGAGSAAQARRRRRCAGGAAHGGAGRGGAVTVQKKVTCGEKCVDHRALGGGSASGTLARFELSAQARRRSEDLTPAASTTSERSAMLAHIRRRSWSREHRASCGERMHDPSGPRARVSASSAALRLGLGLL